MGLALNEDQTLLKDTADAFFADTAPVSAFRRLRDSGRTHDADLWAGVSALGLGGALIAEAHGGSAMGFRALALALEAEARHLAVSPLFQTGWVAAAAIAAAGTESDQAEFLPGIAAGASRWALALDEGPHHKPSGFSTRLSDGVVLGAKPHVPDGMGASHLLVAVSTPDGPGLALVAGDAPGLTRAPRDSVDSRDLAALVFEGAPGRLIGGGALDPAVLDRVLDIARIGVAAQMLGLIDACFAMTNEYLKTRTQFGQLIGSFQAMQHRAAAMLVEMELTRSAVVAALDLADATHSGAAPPERLAEAASFAKARAGDTLHLVTNETLQMHGGIGMTDAHDSGLYVKRARVLEALYGSAAFHRDRWARLNAY